MFRQWTAATIGMATAMGLAACGGGGDDDHPPTPVTPVAVGDTVLLTSSGKLASINRAAPATLIGSVTVTGVASGETLHGIDYRPADSLLYALGSTGRIYTIAPATGIATEKAVLKAAAGDDNPYTGLTGSDFAVDFNPVADRLRVISNTGMNLRINVDTGDTITDGAISPASGTASITAGAYTNSFAGTSSTALFDIDPTTGTLYLQDPPNNGVLATGVPLGLSAAATAVNGFDVDARSNLGFAALSVGSTSTLYTVNLSATSAAATRVGDIGTNETVRGLALVQPAAPTALGLSTDNRLFAFDPKAPNTLTRTLNISGLPAGETVVGIDMRPADRQLYALTSAAKLYTVNTTTGAATVRSTLAADPTDPTAPYGGLAGTVFSVDFNPVADRLRVITDTGLNLRINVDTGLVTTDGAINRAGAAPGVVAAAYSNSFVAPASTVLYDLDTTGDLLSRQDPPNNGTLVDLGPLGVSLIGTAGFDIAGGANGLALAAMRASASGPYSLYSISLATGAATLSRGTADAGLSLIGGAAGPALIDLAIVF